MRALLLGIAEALNDVETHKREQGLEVGLVLGHVERFRRYQLRILLKCNVCEALCSHAVGTKEGREGNGNFGVGCSNAPLGLRRVAS